MKIHPDALADVQFGIAVQKNSGLQNILNHVIQTIREDGTLVKLYSKWMTASCIDHTNSNVYKAIHFASEFFIVTAALGLSFAALIIEKLWYKRKGKFTISSK